MGVGRISKDALAAFEAEQMAGAVVPVGETVATTRRLCASATMVPATGSLPAEGEKYQPEAVEFQTGDADAGWTCLSFSMNQAMNFQYDYNTDSAATGAADDDVMLAFAQANMGGQVMIIGMAGLVQEGQLTLAPALTEVSLAAGDELGEDALEVVAP
jgi:hypothetical protein